MRVFVNGAGLLYAAEVAANKNDGEKLFVSEELKLILAASPIPMNEEQVLIVRDYLIQNPERRVELEDAVAAKDAADALKQTAQAA
jgi:hypothetical protein